MAEAALERYGLRGARLVPLREPGFKDVFRVSAAGRGESVLRMYDAPRLVGEGSSSGDELRTGARLRSAETLRSQVLWLFTLRRETSLLVPEPIPTADGALTGYVSVQDIAGGRLSLILRRYRPTSDPGRHFLLLRWMAGRQKRDDLGPDDLSLVGSYAARLHRHSERHAVPECCALPRWDWRWPFGETALLWSKGAAFYSQGEMAVFRAASRRVWEELRTLGESADVFGLIHRDLQPDNFVFREGAVGAIDFDLCGRGHYLLDLAITLLALKNRFGRRCAPLQAALLRDYGRERPLPKDYRGNLKAFVAMLTVASVNRSLALLGSGADEEQARRERFLSNAAKRLENFDVAMQPLVDDAPTRP